MVCVRACARTRVKDLNLEVFVIFQQVHLADLSYCRRVIDPILRFPDRLSNFLVEQMIVAKYNGIRRFLLADA